MAGCSLSSDGSSLDHREIVSKLQSTNPCVNVDASKQSYSKCENTKFQRSFNHYVSSLLKDLCPSNHLRPLHPMLGNGQFVDLLKLYSDLKEKGGYDAVSKNELWDLLAEEQGLGRGIGSALELFYIKYLDKIERDFAKLAGEKGLEGSSWCTFSNIEGTLMGLETGLQCFVSKDKEKTKDRIQNTGMAKTKDGIQNAEIKRCELSFTDRSKEDNELHNLNIEKSEISTSNDASSDLSVNDKSLMDSNAVDNCLTGKVANSSGNSSASEKILEKDDKDIMNLDSNKADNIHSLKRKRKCLSGMLSWIADVAKNPVDPAIGELPKISSWKSYSGDKCWKHVLSAREALFLKLPGISSAEQSGPQKRQKMHPSMFDDDVRSSHPRLPMAKILKAHGSSGTSSSSGLSDAESTLSPSTEERNDQRGKRLLRSRDKVDSIFGNQPRKRIPIGRSFQAEIPEWTGVVTESDTKWLGTRVWPTEKREHTLIERDPMGRGRQDSCGCELPGSVECVRFHITEKKKKVKLECGSAFYQWKFDKMGEEVALSWAAKDEKKFKSLVKANPHYLSLDFWDQLMKNFPAKSREDLVSYYFNVFLLRRRGYQNRNAPGDIDSDDEQAEPATANVSKV